MARYTVLMALTLILVSAMLLPGCGGDSEGPEGPTDPACGLNVQSLAFGEVAVGGSLDLTFKITNTGGGTLAGTVSDAYNDFTIVGNAGYRLAAGDTATITVRFSPASAGAKACTLDTGASQCPCLPCSGTGVAVAPVCQVNPASIGFNIVLIGYPLDRTFTITNTGGGTLSGSVSESSDDYSLISGGGDYSLTANQSVTVTVQFAPTSEGTKICTIATGGSCAAVSCTGEGVLAPVCDVNVSGLDFGAIAIGTGKDTTFTITNAGGWWLAGEVYTSCADVWIVSDPEYSLGAGESATFTVRFGPSSLGPLECTILLNLDYCEDIDCTGSGVAGPVCEVDPDTLDFGYMEVGSSADRTFTIRNTTGGTLSGTVSSPCSEFAIVGSNSYSLGEAESATFTVRFAPAGVGADTCTIDTGSGICTDVAAMGGGAPHGDYYVHASSGSDTNPGTVQAPFKTITYAVTAAGPDKTICVLPGTYDTALGETFPIVLGEGQSLLGDVANKGAGASPVVIYGSGYAGELPWGSVQAALVAADGSSITGLSMSAPYGTHEFGIYVSDVTASITDNTFGSLATDLYGGMCVKEDGASTVADNNFLTYSYGIYNYHHVGPMTVESNTFQTMAIPIDIVGISDSTLIRGNTFIGDGQCGMQVQGGAPLIQNNTFNHPGGYLTYGAISCTSSDATPKVRGNVFTCARGVYIEAAAPELGTAGDPGGNDFSGVSGAAIYHMGASPISAVGNTWASSPPGCGSDIVVTGAGSVTWGTGVGESCP